MVAYLIPQDSFLSIDFLPLRYGLASLVAFLPVFLANLVFAGSFKGTGPTADVAFASNLIGIMLGGMLEYASLADRLPNLLLIVIGFYVLSALLAAPASRASQCGRGGGARAGRRCRMVEVGHRPRQRQLSLGRTPALAADRSLSRPGAAASAAWRCATRPIRTIKPIVVSEGAASVLALLDGQRTLHRDGQSAAAAWRPIIDESELRSVSDPPRRGGFSRRPAR